jgi:hypothetical protein
VSYRIWNRRNFKWVFLTIAPLPALPLFCVQQWIAAFALFSVGFACLAGALLVIFLLGHIAETVLVCAVAYLRVLGYATRRSLDSAEALALSQLQYFRRAVSEK